MSYRKRVIHIKSQNRTSGTPENFYVPLNSTIQNVVEMELLMCQIPNTTYNVTPFNNRLDFTYNVTGNYTVFVTPGNYNICDFLCILQNEMNLAISGPPIVNYFILTYSAQTFRITFTAQGPFSLNFNVSPTLNMSFLLGFGASSSSFPSTGNVLIVPGAPEFWIPAFIYINVRELGAQSATTSLYPDNPTFIVPVSSGAGCVILWTNNSQFYQKVYCGNQAFSGFNISLQQSNIPGRPIYLYNNNSEWDMILSIVTKEQSGNQVLNSGFDINRGSQDKTVDFLP
jgi:hypothetical protein